MSRQQLSMRARQESPEINGLRRPGRRCSADVIGLLLLLSGACDAQGEESAEAEAVLRLDSAGIEIVENLLPVWSPGEGWTVDPQPVLQIGVLEGDPVYQFEFPFDVSRHSDGRIAVADGEQIRVFDSRGTHLVSIGRRGAGPGEFQTNPKISWLPPDTLMAWDAAARRISWFRDDGELLRDVALTFTLPVPVPQPYWSVAPNRGILAVGTRGSTVYERYPRTLLEWLPLFIPADGGPPVELGVLPGGEFRAPRAPGAGASVSGVSNPFVSPVLPALRADPLGIILSSSGPWELRILEPGGALVQIVRAAIPRGAVTDER